MGTENPTTRILYGPTVTPLVGHKVHFVDSSDGAGLSFAQIFAIIWQD